jgi:hypothetical protein
LGFGLGPTGSWKTDFVISSVDGLNWSEPRVVDPDFGTDDTFHVCFGNGEFVATANETDWGSISYSTNGVTWSYPTSAGWGLYLGDITYGGGQFVALGERDSPSAVLTSADGVSWATHEIGAPDNLLDVTYGNGRFVALGSFGTNLTSADGTNWTRVPSGTDASLNAITYGRGQFVAVGDAVVTSPDGLNWLQRTAYMDSSLYDITYGSGEFVAVGISGSILSSADGIYWQRRSSGTDRNLWGVAYGGGHFVAVGDYGTILESDSIIRLAVSSSVTKGLITIFLTGPAGLASTIQSSPDLISWRNLTNITTTQTGAVVFDVVPGALGAEFYRAYSQ